MALLFSEADDALAELESLLAPFGLSELAPFAYELQLRGVTDPQQIFFELERTSVFQSRFPFTRDPETGALLADVSTFVSYEQQMAQRMADLGIPQDLLGVPLNVFVGQLIANRRSLAEVSADLEAFALLRENPTIRRDFYAYTGVDPGDVGVFALILGEAPDLREVYAQLATNVDADLFLQRRFEFEDKIEQEKARIEALQSDVTSIQAQVLELDTLTSQLRTQGKDIRKRLGEVDAKGNFIIRGDERAALWAEIRDLFAQANAKAAEASELKLQITNIQSQQEAGRVAISGFESELSDLIKGAPGLPKVTLGSPLAPRDMVLRALRRAQAAEKSRFQAGGSLKVADRPVASQTAF